jgi:lipoyl(octanoyl) transferase
MSIATTSASRLASAQTVQQKTDHISLSSSLLSARDLFGAPFDIIIEEAQNPHHNMAFDHARALACAEGTAAPMLRLYSWKPWAVSLGAHQRDYDIDLEACSRAGFEVVRRPTGGRAVLHANELTYSVVLPLATRLQPERTIHDVYRDVHILLLEALHRLGATAISFEKTQPDLRAHYRSGAHSMVCFSSSARYELTWLHGGTAKKVVGSAQRLYTPAASGKTNTNQSQQAQRQQAVVLQHGSILLGSGHERLASVARTYAQGDDRDQPNQRDRAAISKALAEKSTTLEEICGHSVSFSACADAVRSVFAAD